MRYISFIFAVLLILFSGKSVAAGNSKFYYTYPMPRKVTPTDPLRIHPAFQVPDFPERYVWVVDGKIGSKEVHKDQVPLYSFKDGPGTPAGFIPVGSEVTLDYFRRAGNVIYYAVVPPETKSVDPNMVLWLSGQFIKPKSLR